MSKTIISFPKLGDYNIPLNFLFKHTTNCKIINSPEITNKTIELGSKYSPSDACLPFKYTLGNFIESLDMGANVLIQAGGGCRYRYYGEVQEQILKDLGYNFDLYQLSNSDKRSIKEIYELFKKLNPTLPYKHFIYYGYFTLKMIYYMDKIDEYIRKNIGFETKKNSFIVMKKRMLREFSKCQNLRQLKKSYFKYKRLFKKIETKKENVLKIGIIGELYTAMEPSSTYNLEYKLAQNNIEIKRFTNLSYLIWGKIINERKMYKTTKRYCKYNLGADGLDNVYRTIYLSKKKYDGIIHTKPFGCTPEITAIPIIQNVCKDYDMPILFFSFDEEQEDGGVNTRLEAFYDVLRYRKEKK